MLVQVHIYLLGPLLYIKIVHQFYLPKLLDIDLVISAGNLVFWDGVDPYIDLDKNSEGVPNLELVLEEFIKVRSVNLLI